MAATPPSSIKRVIDLTATEHENSYRSPSEMFAGYLYLIQTEKKLCLGRNETTSCLRYFIAKETKQAYRKKEIDEFEYKVILQLSHYVHLIDKKVILKNPPTLKYPNSLIDYLGIKHHFEMMREQRGVPPDFSPKLHDAFKKQLKPRRSDLGLKDPISSLLSRFSRGQINLLADLIDSELDLTQAIDAKVVFNFDPLQNEIEKYKTKASELSKEKAILSLEYDQNREEIESLIKEQDSLLNKINALEQTTPGFQLTRLYQELDALQALLERSDASAPHSTDLDTIKQKIATTLERIDSLEEIVKNLNPTRELTRGDLTNYVMNSLEVKLLELNGSPTFKFQKADYRDLMIAYLLSGRVNEEAILALLENPDFIENPRSALKTVGSVLWSAGRLYLMLNPFTTIPTTLTVTIVQAIQKKKQYEIEEARKTHAIRR